MRCLWHFFGAGSGSVNMFTGAEIFTIWFYRFLVCRGFCSRTKSYWVHPVEATRSPYLQSMTLLGALQRPSDSGGPEGTSERSFKRRAWEKNAPVVPYGKDQS